MSWKAVDWATDADVGSPILKLILILLANKADEQFSCYPSIRTLMAESAAGRSTVLRALKTLETDGLVTRRAQFHESGAQRSSRYYLNHPDAPHLDPRPDSGAPVRPLRRRAAIERAPDQVRHGPVPIRDRADPTTRRGGSRSDAPREVRRRTP